MFEVIRFALCGANNWAGSTDCKLKAEAAKGVRDGPVAGLALSTLPTLVRYGLLSRHKVMARTPADRVIPLSVAQ